MYTKITIVGYVKQSEEDIEIYKALNGDEVTEKLSVMEEQTRIAFEAEDIELSTLKVEVVEDKA